MFKKHRQDYEHSKNAQFDIYPITFLEQISMKFCKKVDNFITNLTTKIFS